MEKYDGYVVFLDLDSWCVHKDSFVCVFFYVFI